MATTVKSELVGVPPATPTAVRAWEPVVRVLVVKVASPVVEMLVVRRFVAPSCRVTLPVGTPLVVLATWVVRVSEEPGEIVGDATVRMVRVGAGAMVRMGMLARV